MKKSETPLHDNPSRDSRFNRWVKFLLSVGTTLGPVGLPISPDLQAMTSLGATAALLAAYDRVYATAFVNRNHQPQILYENPV